MRVDNTQSAETLASAAEVRKSEVLILFTRYPEAGRAKSRLAGFLGADAAANLQRRMTEHVVSRVAPWVASRGRSLEIRFNGGSVEQMRQWLGGRFRYCAQGDGDLGVRLRRAFDDHFAAGADSVVIIGADCPGVDEGVVNQAFSTLARENVVFGPAVDGGYYLIGLTKARPDLFRNIDWGTSRVLRQSVSRCRRAGIVPAWLPPLRDVDHPEDLCVWAQTAANRHMISVIIPTLNEASQIEGTLARVRQETPCEVIIADGGSTDATCALAGNLGIQVVSAPRGRSRQLNAGAKVAQGGILFFLHADSWPPAHYAQLIAECLAGIGVAAGAFSFALREPIRGRRLLEGLVNLRSRWLHWPYGDQGLFVRRELFETLGGFPDLPILEDVEMVRRLHRCGRVVTLASRMTISARRWERLGLWRTLVLNQRILVGYLRGVPPQRLAGLYAQDKRRDQRPKVPCGR
jgi:rSAM/selenodomain-associated transferase 2/rSAM/selenodomain-associated transferase 1